ncbi:hypothetical protein J7E88_29445 [Streptomyces sp. ISL-10]|nr:hypothetical protein [Streptomyces sp. ISL-10]
MTLFDAVTTRSPAQVEDIAIPAILVADADDRQVVRTWLWSVLLADGTRALTTAGRWTEALAHVEAHRGIGQRMLDGRQVAVLAALATGDPVLNDGYAARESLTHPLFTALATDGQQKNCRDIVDACALGAGKLPDELRDQLATALRTSDRTIRERVTSTEPRPKAKSNGSAPLTDFFRTTRARGAQLQLGPGTVGVGPGSRLTCSIRRGALPPYDTRDQRHGSVKARIKWLTTPLAAGLAAGLLSGCGNQAGGAGYDGSDVRRAAGTVWWQTPERGRCRLRGRRRLRRPSG